MKSSMPRLIDDQRRNRFRWMLFGIVVIVTASLLAYSAWMRPYRERRAMIAATIREGNAELARLREDRESAAESKISAAEEALRGIEGLRVGVRKIPSLMIDTAIYIPEDLPRAEKLKSAYTEAEEAGRRALRDFGMATNRATAILARLRSFGGAPGRDTTEAAESNLQQSLNELETLYHQVRPDADATSEAMGRFNQAFGGLSNARASLGNRSDGMVATISEAKAVADAAKKAALRVKEAVDAVSGIERTLGTLRIDKGEQRQTSLRFAEALERDALQIRADVNSLWESVTNSGKEAEAAITDAHKRMNKIVEAMRELIRNHGEFVAKAPCESLEAARLELHEETQSLRKELANWTDGGKQGVARQTLLAAAERKESFAKTLRGDAAAPGSAKPDVADETSTKEFRNDALAFVADMGNVSATLEEFVQKARDALTAAESRLPDWDHEWRRINEERERIRATQRNAMQEIDRAEASLKGYQSDGETLREVVEKLRSARRSYSGIAAHASDLPRAATGKALEGQRSSNKTLASEAAEAKASLATALELIRAAMADGRLYQVEYVPGATFMVGAIDGPRGSIRGPELNLSESLSGVGISTSSGRRIEKPAWWDFSVEIPASGIHEISIRLRKSQYSMNREIEGTRSEFSHVRDGEIVLYSRLSVGALVDRTEKSFGNKQRLDGKQERCTVAHVRGSMPAGWTDVRFTLDSMKTDPGDKVTGWDYSGVSFVVYLDGKPVKELYRKTHTRFVQ